MALARPYQSFTVLLDDPAAVPRLGFDVYADAFAQIIEHSKPQFAIGIFGDWGSGKTTLMRAIEQRIRSKPALVLPVWFNAWRYEREEHLIVPLLDNLREALLEWSAQREEDDATAARARRAATMFGRAGRALLRGLTIKGGLPGLEATFALEKLLEATGADERPSSFYHAAFQDVQAATRDFVAGGGDRRIVVFVDDLDRCLPVNALQVLESMKLFFDLEGFVFVVGLDQAVIERSIESKYQASSPETTQLLIERPTGNGDGDRDAATGAAVARGYRSEHRAPISGAEYMKKIFQVPFALPRIGTNQLDELLDALRATPGLPPAQSTDLEQAVRPHLVYITDRETLNPREVKRLVNAYTLQMKLLEPRLGPAVSADTVLAIQLMGFRPDWLGLYEALVSDPDGFAREVAQALAQPPGEPSSVGDENEPLPQSFIAYLRGRGSALLDQGSLGPYVSSAEQTRSVESGSQHARQAIRGLRRTLNATEEHDGVIDPGVALSEIGALRQSLSGSGSPQPGLVEEGMAQIDRLERQVKDLASKTGKERSDGVRRALATLDRIAEVVREIRRQSG